MFNVSFHYDDQNGGIHFGDVLVKAPNEEAAITYTTGKYFARYSESVRQISGTIASNCVVDHIYLAFYWDAEQDTTEMM